MRLIDKFTLRIFYVETATYDIIHAVEPNEDYCPLKTCNAHSHFGTPMDSVLELSMAKRDEMTFPEFEQCVRDALKQYGLERSIVVKVHSLTERPMKHREYIARMFPATRPIDVHYAEFPMRYSMKHRKRVCDV